jgi:hypothetical protein
MRRKDNAFSPFLPAIEVHCGFFTLEFWATKQRVHRTRLVARVRDSRFLSASFNDTDEEAFAPQGSNYTLVFWVEEWGIAP